MDVLWQHALLVAAVACVAGTGWRVASLAAPCGLERVVATATLAVAALVVETLALGVAGLAEHSLLLFAAAAAGFAAARAATPKPALSARAEAAEAWGTMGSGARAGAGAGLAVLAGWIAWQLVHPNVGFDGETYHLPLSAAWAQTGHTAEIVDAIDGLPVGNYPITNEVIVAWALGLSRSWVAASIWSPLIAALLVLSGWLGLRRLNVGRMVAGASALAYVLLPLVSAQLGGPLTDVPCAAWLVTAGALCVASREHAGLLPIAVIAAGLSFGTKTTGSVLLLIALGTTLWLQRPRLSAPLLAAAGVAVVVGGLWTLRNLIDHGSPLWPFVSGPFGDPLPPGLRGLDAAFLDHPADMLRDRASLYAQNLSGGLLLLGGGLLAPLIGRSKASLAAGGVTLLAILVWAKAPYTGIAGDTRLAVGAIRYLLPAMAAGTLALAVAARDGGAIGRRVALTILITAAFLSSSKSFGELGFPYVPSGSTVVGLALVGAVAALVLPRLPLRRTFPALAVVGVVAGLASAADGYVQRQTEAGTIDQGVLRAALADERWREGHFPIAMGPLTAALLRGDDVAHDVTLLRAGAPCTGAGWKIVVTVEESPEATALQHCLRGRKVLRREPNFTIYE